MHFYRRAFFVSIAGASIDVRTVNCPYTEDNLVPALKPDVALVHAQQADKAGNIQMIGVNGDNRAMAGNA